MVYSAIDKVIIMDRATPSFLMLKDVSKVVLSEVYNYYNDIEGNYINLYDKITISIIILDTTREIIDRLNSCKDSAKDILIIGLDGNEILIEDIFIIVEISRKYPKVHELVIKAAKDYDGLLMRPDKDILRDIGNFENNNGQIGNGWVTDGTVTPSIIDNAGNAIQQLDFFRARAPQGQFNSSIRSFFGNGVSYNISGNVQNISGENNDLLINLDLIDNAGNAQEFNYIFPLPDNNNYLFSFSFIPAVQCGKININITLPFDYNNQVIQLDNIQLIKE